MRALARAAQLLLAAVFLFAGAQKGKSFHEAALAVGDFDLLTPRLSLWVAVLLPGVEVVVGAALLTGFKRRGACLVSALLGLMFLVVVASAIWRGLDVECGCFGELAISPRADLTTLGVDLAILALAGIGYAGADPRVSTRPRSRATAPPGPG